MSYVIGVIGWMLIGFATMFVGMLIHATRAIQKGYDFESEILPVWEEIDRVDLKSFEGFAGFVLGLIIWPQRFVVMLNTFDYFYYRYEERLYQKYLNREG